MAPVVDELDGCDRAGGLGRSGQQNENSGRTHYERASSLLTSIWRGAAFSDDAGAHERLSMKSAA